MDLATMPTEELEKILAEQPEARDQGLEVRTPQPAGTDLSKLSDAELEAMLPKEPTARNLTNPEPKLTATADPADLVPIPAGYEKANLSATPPDLQQHEKDLNVILNWDSSDPNERARIREEETQGLARMMKENPPVKAMANAVGSSVVGKTAQALINLTDGKDAYPTFLHAVQSVNDRGLASSDDFKNRFFTETLPKLAVDSPLYMTLGYLTKGWGTFSTMNVLEQALDKYNTGKEFDEQKLKTSLVTDLLFKAVPGFSAAAGGPAKRLLAEAGNIAKGTAILTGTGVLDKGLNNEDITLKGTAEDALGNALLVGVMHVPQLVKAGNAGLIEQAASKAGMPQADAAQFANTLVGGKKANSMQIVTDLFKGDESKIKQFAKAFRAEFGEAGIVNRAERMAEQEAGREPWDLGQNKDGSFSFGGKNGTGKPTQPAPLEISGPETTVRPPAAPAGEPTAEAVIMSRSQTVEGVRPGAATTVYGSKGTTYPANYAVVPRSLIQASHDGVSFAKNPQYPLDNTRDYSAPGEQEKVLSVRNGFDPARHVTDSPDAAVGPSMVARVIGEDGTAKLVVLGGNNREMAIATMSPEKRQELANFTNERIDRFGVDPLKSPDEELVRYMGEFDLRKDGTRGELQKVVDSLNPSPGKVQNLAEMATVDAANGLPIEQLARVPMDVSPADAQIFLANAIKAGSLDRNLRSQIAEHPQQAAEYVRRLMVNAAFRSPELADFHASTSTSSAATRGLVESAVPALVEMRAKGLHELADAFTRSMQVIVNDYAKTGKLNDALMKAAQQMDLDPRYGVVNEVAAKLGGLVELNKKGAVDAEATTANFAAFWKRMQSALQQADGQPDMFGAARSPEEVIRGLLKSVELMPRNQQGNNDLTLAKEAFLDTQRKGRSINVVFEPVAKEHFQHYGLSGGDSLVEVRFENGFSAHKGLIKADDRKRLRLQTETGEYFGIQLGNANAGTSTLFVRADKLKEFSDWLQSAGWNVGRKPLVISAEEIIIRNEASNEKSDGNDSSGRRQLGETGNLSAGGNARDPGASKRTFEAVLDRIARATRGSSREANRRAAGYKNLAYSEELASRPEFQQLSELCSSWGIELYPAKNVPFAASNFANIVFISENVPTPYLKLSVYHEGFHNARLRDLPGTQDAVDLVNINSPAVQAYVRMRELEEPGYFDVADRNAEIAEEFVAEMFGGGISFNLDGKRILFSDGVSRPDQFKDLFAEVERYLESNVGREQVPDFGARGVDVLPRSQGPYDLTGKPEMDSPIAIRFTEAGRLKAAKLGDWQKMQMGGLEFVRPMEMPEILKLSRALGVDPGLKKLPKAYGHMKPIPGAPQIVLDPRIFKDPALASRVLSHEIGHLTDFMPDQTMQRGNILGRLYSLKEFRKNVLQGESEKTAKELQKEIYELSKWWRPFDEDNAKPSFLKYRKSSVECYADALSVLLNSPAELKARAPKFWNTFFKTIERKPDVKANLLGLWDQLQRPESDLLRDRSADIRRMFGRGEEILLRKAKERELRFNTFRGWIDRFKMQYSDVYYPIVKRTRALKAQGKKVPWHEDPEMLFDEHPLAEGNKSYRFMDRLYKKIIQPLEAAELSLDQLGEYLFLNRVMNEQLGVAVEAADGSVKLDPTGRQALANPLGMQPAQARKQLLNMRLGIGIEKMTLLDDFARTFQEHVFDVVQQAGEVGTYNREYVEGTLAPNKYNYSAFAVLDHLEHNEHIPAGIRKQVGTLKDIANPFTATVLKMQTLMRWNQINKVHSAALDVMAEWGEAEKALVKMAGGRVFPKPAPSGKVLFSRMVNGNPEHWYVDPEVPAMFEHRSPAEQDAILQVLNTGFRKIIYPMWITYNPAFNMLMNPIRDFRRTHRNLPINSSTVSGWKLLKEYAVNRKAAVRRLKHESDPLIAEMLENFAIGSPFDSFVSNVYRDDYFGKMLQKFNMMPEAEQASWKKQWFIKPLVSLLKEIEFHGQIMESLPKIAAYKILTKDLGWDPRTAANYTRNYLGTPNYMKRGKHAYGGGTLIPFFNIFVRGWESDLKTATDPKTRFGFWWKYASTNGMWTMMKALGAAGLFGVALKEWFDGVSEYNKTNYDIVPLGKVSGGEFGRKSFGLRIPKDEFSRFTDGILYKAVYGMATGDITEQRWNQVFALGAGQMPGLTPFYQIGSTWTEYMSGNNPYDYFYNSPILTNDQWLEGGWESMKGMIGWTAKNIGIQNYVKFNPDADSVTESILGSTPVLNKALFISDYGFREQQQGEEKAEQRANAIVRNDMSREVISAKNEYYRLRRIGDAVRTPEQQTRYEEAKDWYKTEYAPAWEEILYYIEDKNMESAKRTAKAIRTYE